jgi:hypothetical protein
VVLLAVLMMVISRNSAPSERIHGSNLSSSQEMSDSDSPPTKKRKLGAYLPPPFRLSDLFNLHGCPLVAGNANLAADVASAITDETQPAAKQPVSPVVSPASLKQSNTNSAVASDNNSDVGDGVQKPACSYGSACYRKNAAHLRDFSHPPKSVLYYPLHTLHSFRLSLSTLPLPSISSKFYPILPHIMHHEPS